MLYAKYKKILSAYVIYNRFRVENIKGLWKEAAMEESKQKNCIRFLF